MVTVEVDDPFAVTEPVPVIVEFAITGEVAENVTVEAPVTATGEVNCNVLTSAFVELRLQVETPEALETEHAP